VLVEILRAFWLVMVFGMSIAMIYAMMTTTGKEEMKKMGKKREITFSIPGGWYGNDPGYYAPDTKAGNVVVNPTKAVHAIRWLSRRAEILGTALSDDANPGLMIAYRLR